MESTFTRGAVEAALTAQGLRYGVLELQDGASALLLERGGRLLGPFLHADAPSLLWLNPVLGDPARFSAFLSATEWNTGGERVWFSPETQWLVRDRSDFWGSVHFPPHFDPGTFALDRSDEGLWRLRQNARLTAYNLATGEKELSFERTFRPVDDPLRYAGAPADLLDGVQYAGYAQSVTISEAQRDAITAQSWVLLQLYAGGEIIVPCSPLLTITDYNEPVADDVRALHEHWASFRITGNRRYKVGLRAAHTFGRLGYYRPEGGGRATLIVRNYFNDPSTIYSEEPAHLPGARGDSIHIYNDAGMFGGFGELEVQGRTIGGESPFSSMRDEMLLWIYEGPVERVARIARHLLGVDPQNARSLPM